MFTREEQLVDILTRRVRALSMPQIAKSLCQGSAGEAAAIVSELEIQGLVESKSVLARPVLQASCPVVNWKPGDDAPDFGKAAYRLKTRWRRPAQPCEVVVATRTAASRFGGYLGGRFPRAAEITHDLNLAAVFLLHQELEPEGAEAWFPEAHLYAEGRGRSGRLPDAVIRHAGVDVKYVEFGGSYGKQKLADFHLHLGHLPYEIW
jgi:hypothetical protein